MMVEANSTAAIHQRKWGMARRTDVNVSWNAGVSLIVSFSACQFRPRSSENSAAGKNSAPLDCRAGSEKGILRERSLVAISLGLMKNFAANLLAIALFSGF